MQQGIIDPEEFLQVIEWPNKEKTIEKLKQRQAAQAQMAATQPPGEPAQGSAPQPNVTGLPQ
mgnify:FL=1